MVSSSCYHLFMCMSQWAHDTFLKLDMVGIGVMIFGLTLTAVYIGFHNWPNERLYVFGLFFFLFLANSILQATPCYI